MVCVLCVLCFVRSPTLFRTALPRTAFRTAQNFALLFSSPAPIFVLFLSLWCNPSPNNPLPFSPHVFQVWSPSTPHFRTHVLFLSRLSFLSLSQMSFFFLKKKNCVFLSRMHFFILSACVLVLSRFRFSVLGPPERPGMEHGVRFALASLQQCFKTAQTLKIGQK